MPLFLFLSQLNHFQILELALVDGETYQGAYLVETRDTGCTWVDVEHVQGLVVLNFEDVRMSTD